MIEEIIKYFDHYLCFMEHKLLKGKSYFLSFCFHKVFKKRTDINKYLVDPQQKTTLEDFRIFIEYFLSKDFSFITPDELQHNLFPNKKTIILSFDDGYYNNNYILPLLEEYKIPCLFFITTSNVMNNEAFWWDIIFRSKSNIKNINHLKRHFRKSKINDIREYIISNFGSSALKPINDYDRPFSLNELKDFSNNQYVKIGNHTHNHNNLTLCSDKELFSEFYLSQQIFQEILGYKPKYMAYPYGFKNTNTTSLISQLDFSYIFTIERKSNRYKNINTSPAEIKRFFGPHGPIDTRSFLSYQVPFSIYYAVSDIYSKW